jgi:putative sterol carrier protein
MFATDVKVLDVETRKMLNSAGSRGEGADSILRTQIDELSRDISVGMGLAREKIQAENAQVVDVTTSSMEAYKYFQKGSEEYDKFYYEAARKSLERTIELTLAMAYYYWLGVLGSGNVRRAMRPQKAKAGRQSHRKKGFI